MKLINKGGGVTERRATHCHWCEEQKINMDPGSIATTKVQRSTQPFIHQSDQMALVKVTVGRDEHSPWLPDSPIRL